ncbi:hypothetical protein PG990_011544 [Apiospora arundinis]
MYNENSAPEVVPSQKEVALHHVHMEPVPMAYSQERMASPPHSAYPPPSQSWHPHTDGQSTLHTAGQESPPKGAAGAPVCGLTQRNFMILCILALLILGGAIGGGIGGGLAASRKESGSNSSQSQPVASSPSSPSAAPEGSSFPAASTASSSPSSSPTSITDQDVKLDCPNIDGKKQTFDKKWTFEYHCGKDFTGSKYDIIFIASYNLEDCVKACMSYNTNRRSNECTAVEFNANMKACAVKNATSDIAMNGASPTRQVLAVLQQ